MTSPETVTAKASASKQRKERQQSGLRQKAGRPTSPQRHAWRAVNEASVRLGIAGPQSRLGA